MSYFTPLQVRSYPTFSASSTGSTLVTTLESQGRFVPMFLHIEVITLTGTLITSPSISMGTTAGGTDIMPATIPTLSLINGVNKVSQTNLIFTGSQALTPGSPIYINVSIAAIGPSVMVLRPDIVGYYV